jgi:hypothetical protein
MLTLLISLMTSLQIYASPQPLAGSSIINSTQSNLAFSQLGFRVDHIPPNWIFKNVSDLASKSIELGPIDKESKATLSFRMEKVAPKTNLEQYVRQYLRDYNQYGFQVSSLQSNKKNSVPSVIVDLSQKNKKTKSRQVFFLKNEKVIIATCLDDSENFEKSMTSCNQILGTFQWR